jgi:hypothetical protein
LGLEHERHVDDTDANEADGPVRCAAVPLP